MPPPSSTETRRMTQDAVEDSIEERARAIKSSFEEQKLLRGEQPTLNTQHDASTETKTVPAQPPSPIARDRTHGPPSPDVQKDDVSDNIQRVPDEHLPSHRERQRWDLSKRLSELMDEVLPKLAVVTQKVNTYTGTDYSGVEALRREIKEQENLVRARRAAIDIAKHSLDTAHAQQASAQKEVVALLERKHSWSAGDLERYMSLIRSEHVNDQAIRQAKESVVSAEAALEEARTQLEKRERAQYHEEQIWSDTIRRNSTWVTFGLMGVNIFLLLLSLAILEPWRRRRMVREIKSALEVQMETRKFAATVTSPAAVAATPRTFQHDLSAIEDMDTMTDIADSENEASTPGLEERMAEALSMTSSSESSPSPAPPAETLVSMVDATLGVAAPPANPRPLPKTSSAATPPGPVDSLDDDSSRYRAPSSSKHATTTTTTTWQSKITAVAHDVLSDRVISMRRIDYTSAILQGAAAGAIITASIIGILRPN
ncbi:sensitivity to high expression protein she9 [Pleosporales sp. CAS-2024a]